MTDTADHPSIAREAAWLRESVGLVDGGAWGWLSIAGPDAAAYLQRIVTQDVAGMTPGSCRPGALLTFRGHPVSLLWIARESPDAFWIECAPGTIDAVRDTLDKSLIMETAELTDAREQVTALVALGPKAAEWAEAVGLPAPEAGQVAAGEDEGVVAIGRAFGEVPGLVVRLPVEGLDERRSRFVAAARDLGGGEAGADAFDVVRIEEGRPRFGAEVTERTLLPEAGLEALISHTKGCYVGQEPMARLRSRGHTNRQLFRLSLPAITTPDAAPPVDERSLFAGADEVGHLTSVAHSAARGHAVALGYIKRSVLEGDGAPTLTLGSASGTTVRIDGPAGIDTTPR